MVCATSLTNDSFCGSIVSGSAPAFVVISPLVSTSAPPGDVVDVPGALVHAVAKSPAIMSSDRIDHIALLRRMHASFLFARLGTAGGLVRGIRVRREVEPTSERSRLPPPLPGGPLGPTGKLRHFRSEPTRSANGWHNTGRVSPFETTTGARSGRFRGS